MDTSTSNSLGLSDLSSVQAIKEILNYWPILVGVCCLVGLGIVFFQFFTSPGSATDKKNTLIKRASTIVCSTVVISIFCVGSVSAGMFDSFTEGGVLDSVINSAKVTNERSTDLIDVKDEDGNSVVSGINRKDEVSGLYTDIKNYAKAEGMGSVEAQAVGKIGSGVIENGSTIADPNSGVIDKAGAVVDLIGDIRSTGTNYFLGKLGDALGDSVTGLFKRWLTK